MEYISSKSEIPREFFYENFTETIIVNIIKTFSKLVELGFLNGSWSHASLTDCESQRRRETGSWYVFPKMVHTLPMTSKWPKINHPKKDVYKANMKAGRIVYSGFGTTVAPDPCSHMFQNFVSFFKPANQLPGDNCNVNIWPIGDKYYAITETSSMREIDPITLETGGRVNSSDFISIHTQVSFWFVNQSTDSIYQTGHPHTDRDGSTYILGTEFGRETNYCFFRPGFRNSRFIESIDNSKFSNIVFRPSVKIKER